MKVLDYLFAPIALAGLVATGWWGLYQSPQRPANLAAQLEQEANAALARNGFDWARVRMRGQRAVLQGAAPSPDAAMAAADVVLHADWPGGVLTGGVTVVEVNVEPGKPVSPYIWQAVKRPEGGYVLTGHVPTRGIAAGIAAEAEELAGGISPESRMAIAAGSPGGNWQGVARFALEVLHEADYGEANLSDRLLRVSAVEPDAATRESLKAKVASLAAPYRGQALIKGLPAWTATHTPDGLVLEGRVPSEAARQALLDAARVSATGEIIDRMEVSAGMPDSWQAPAQRFLPSFAAFSAGTMGYYPAEGDVGLAIEGEAPAGRLYALGRDVADAGSGVPVVLWARATRIEVSDVQAIDFAADPAAACQQAFDTVTAADPLVFETGTLRLAPESGPALEKVEAVSHLCAPDLLIEVAGHSDSEASDGPQAALATAQAEAVVAYMVSTGFDPHRLSAVGSGPDQGAGSNDTAEGLPAGPSIEFRVLTRSK